MSENGRQDVVKVESSSQENENNLSGPKFSPPLYKQRYEAVSKIVNASKARRVLDIGCSEGKLLKYLKNNCLDVEELIGVDIDWNVLECNRGRIYPLTSDYLFKRTRPLRVALYEGSVAKPDLRFQNFDLVACVEIIEHLYEDCLTAFPNAIFGLLRPKCVIITTPNADFNVLFPDLQGFRHADHKFEWTREEFQTWALAVVKEYEYDVEISGIGSGPPGTEYLGCCSQMAIFNRRKPFTSIARGSDCLTGSFKLIAESIYPYSEDTQTPEEKLVKELQYHLDQWFSSPMEENDDYTTEEVSKFREVPLEQLLGYHRIKSLCGDIDSLRRNTQLNSHIYTNLYWS